MPGLPGGGIAGTASGWAPPEARLGAGQRVARRRGAGRWGCGAAPGRRGRAGWGQARPRRPAPRRRAARARRWRGRPAVLVDATLGLGGHAAALLAAHPQLTLVGLDRDPEALALAGRRLAAYADRTHLVHAVYDRIAEVLGELGLPRVDGVLFDLGVSSLQLDADERGLLLLPRRRPRHADGPDHRARPRPTCSTPTRCPQLARVLREYGEERFAGRIASAVGRRRAQAPLRRSAELVELLYDAVPAASRRTGGHPAKRTFQALRIEVNGELDALRAALPGRARRAGRGRADRRAGLPLARGPHRQARAGRAGRARPRRWACRSSCPGHGPELRLLVRGAEQAGEDEIADNPRAASVRLRAAERIREAAA